MLCVCAHVCGCFYIGCKSVMLREKISTLVVKTACLLPNAGFLTNEAASTIVNHMTD